jgi:predicted signal transduction protein with EAL and GGDEF domain
MIILGGGFARPLYALMYTSTIAAAMRYGYGPTGVLTVGFVAIDFLVVTAFLASYLREQARRAEVALQMQLARAKHDALHDRLTQLPNRVFLTDRLVEAFNQPGDTATSLAVLCFDLDRFKEINDTVGHRRGDHRLRQRCGHEHDC